MNYLLFWLSFFAFTGVIARPVSYSNDFATYRDTEYDLTDAINWPTNTNVAQDTPLRYDPLIVATNPQGSKNFPDLRAELRNILDKVYKGEYGDLDFKDLGHIMGEEVKDYVTKKVDEILCKPSGVLSDELADMVDRTREKTPQVGNERSSEGSIDQTTDGEQEDSSLNSLVIQGLTPDELAKFVMATMVVAGAPQAQIGLQGIDLSLAIFEALPGFLRTITGGWNPAGL